MSCPHRVIWEEKAWRQTRSVSLSRQPWGRVLCTVQIALTRGAHKDAGAMAQLPIRDPRAGAISLCWGGPRGWFRGPRMQAAPFSLKPSGTRTRTEFCATDLSQGPTPPPALHPMSFQRGGRDPHRQQATPPSLSTVIGPPWTHDPSVSNQCTSWHFPGECCHEDRLSHPIPVCSPSSTQHPS